MTNSMRYAFIATLLAVACSPIYATAQRPVPGQAERKASASAAVRLRIIDASGSFQDGIGALIDARGLIVTEQSAVAMAKRIEVVNPPEGRMLLATLLRKDTATGVAILQVSGLATAPLMLARRTAVRGESVRFFLYDTLQNPRIVTTRVASVNKYAEGTLLHFEATAGPEINGAPVVGEAGEMIAIAYSSEDAGQTRVVGIPSRDVIAQLQVAGLMNASVATAASERAATPPAVAPTRAPSAPASASFWLHQGGPSEGDGRVTTTESLIGKTFLFVPTLADEMRPNYDYRMLLTFTPTQLAIAGPLVSGTYATEYKSTSFQSAALGFEFTYYALLGFNDERIHLRMNPPGNVASIALGTLRELNAEQAKTFRSYMAQTEAQVLARDRASGRTSAAAPMRFLDVTGLPASSFSAPLISRIYYGQFSQIFGDSQQGMFSRLNGITMVKHLYRTYHEQYFKVYGDVMPEPSTLIQVSNVVTNGAGQVQSKDSLYTIRLRTRFAATYMAAKPTTGDALAMIIRSVDTERQQIDNGKLMNEMLQGAPLRAFIERNRTASPGTLARFEENLQRAVVLQSPLLINEPGQRFDLGATPHLLPGEVIAATVEGNAARGVTWTRPARWEKRTRGYGLAVWDVGPEARAQAIIDVQDTTVRDLVPYINLYRFRQNLAAVKMESEQAIERIDLGGRTALLMSFPTATNVMIVEDGRTWFVTLYGNRSGVADAMPEFREFLKSLKFDRPPSRN